MSDGATCHYCRKSPCRCDEPTGVHVLEIVERAATVALYGWGTSVSEAYHNERMAAMDRLRAALPNRDDMRGMSQR